MAKTRKKYSAEFKFKAVLRTIKGEETASQLAGQLEVHPVVLSDWKKQFMALGMEVFEKKRSPSKHREEEQEKTELFEQIGRLKMELEWTKKKLNALT